MFGLSVRLPVSGLAMHGDSDNNGRTFGRPFVCQGPGKPRIITMLTKRMLESLICNGGGGGGVRKDKNAC